MITFEVRLAVSVSCAVLTSVGDVYLCCLYSRVMRVMTMTCTRVKHVYANNKLTSFLAHTCAHNAVVPGSWCTVHGVVSEHKFSVISLDHS